MEVFYIEGPLPPKSIGRATTKAECRKMITDEAFYRVKKINENTSSAILFLDLHKLRATISYKKNGETQVIDITVR